MARRRDDEYDDDDDDYDDRAREPKSSGGMPKWPFFVLGGLLLVLLICGGGIFGIYYLVKSAVSNVVSKIPAPAGTHEATDAEITDALNELKGPNKFFPLARITGYKPKQDRRREVCQALEALLSDRDTTTQSQAAQALAIWGTEDSVPALVKALQSQDFFVRTEVIKALGEIKSEKAAGPLAARLTDGSDRLGAADALKKIGPKAESEVVKYLANSQNDANARMEACNILAEIGTKNGGSIPALQKAAKDQNFIVANAANAAITSINNSRR
jgi:HEAT repeat protein